MSSPSCVGSSATMTRKHCDSLIAHNRRTAEWAAYHLASTTNVALRPSLSDGARRQGVCFGAGVGFMMHALWLSTSQVSEMQCATV
jgi:hypothetical protein